MRKVARALISLSDKTGAVAFAQGLSKMGVEIVSTGGTARSLKEAGVPVRGISDLTGFPEILGGRVKTLHPRVHGGLLAVRENPDHMREVEQHGIPLIDLVAVNLYPFQQTVAKPVSMDEAIEQIDIGGVCLIRASAKNWKDVILVTCPEDYDRVLEALQKGNGTVSDALRLELAQKGFSHTAEYDRAISDYLGKRKM